MTDFNLCISEIQKATGDRLTEADLEGIASEIIKRAKRGVNPTKDAAQLAREAADRIGREAEEAVAIEARNKVENLRKRMGRDAFYMGAPSPEVGLEAKLVGVNTPFAGSRLSVEAQQKALQHELVGGLVQDLEREGLDKLFASRTLEKEWATELFELSRGDLGQPGITKNADALKIAETVQRYQRAAMEGLNNAGAWVRDMMGYITKTTHDPAKIRRAGKDEWVLAVMQTADWKRTFGNREYAFEALGKLYDDFSRGVHLKFEEDENLLAVALPGANLAKRASVSREIQFSSAEGWLEYNREYGISNPTETIVNALRRAANATALMREFGTNPRAAFEADLNRLKNDAPAETLDRIERKERGLRNRLNFLDGTADIPENETLAAITRGVMGVQRMSKLGMTPFAMLSDLATKASELRYQGVPVMERYATMISGYFRGMSDPVRREVAELLHAGLEARIGNVVSRFHGEDQPRGVMARMENFFFRVTSISAMTDNQRLDFQVMFARDYGAQRERAFDALPSELQRTLKQFAISPDEWDALRAVDWGHGGRDYLTPDRAHMIPDSVAEALAEGEGAIRQTGGQVRDALALKVQAMYADRADYAILAIGANERALMFQGGDDMRPGTPLGTAVRLMMQFKSFPVAMIARTWGREIYGGQGRMGAVSGIVQLIVGATLAGVAANMMSDIAKGRDPLAPWKRQPVAALARGFTRGGVASIYGDLLLAQSARGTAAQLALGPTLGSVNDLHDLYTAARLGQDFRAKLVRFGASNTPFANVWYTKAAIDYLVLYQLQEAISPGYLGRMERRQKDQSGTEYLLRPSAVVR